MRQTLLSGQTMAEQNGALVAIISAGLLWWAKPQGW
jgi:hypothetical protein